MNWSIPKRATAAFAALALMAVASQAHAQARGYILNGQAWAGLNPVEQMAYVQGLNDYANFAFVNDDLETAVAKVARNRCLIELSVTPNVLATIITNGYSQQPQLAQEPPLFVYVVRLADICRSIFNEERSRMGLPIR